VAWFSRSCVLAFAAVVFVTNPVQASPIDPFQITFFNLTNNVEKGVPNPDISAQLLAEMTAVGTSQVAFTFWNIGSEKSVISEIYFDDGTLLGIATVTSSSGVTFIQGAKPPDLPGGETASPPFQVTAGFLAEATNPAPTKGVNNTATGTEWVKITFDLINGKTYADTVNALSLGGADGGLRVGLHVIGLANGGSDSYINNPPPPVKTPEGGTTVVFLGTALAVLAFALRRLA
jgi:hypothetical protein